MTVTRPTAWRAFVRGEECRVGGCHTEQLLQLCNELCSVEVESRNNSTILDQDPDTWTW